MMPSKAGKKRKWTTIRFPKAVAEIIVDYAATYEISPWIREICAEIHPNVCRNPMAMDIISSGVINIDGFLLCGNPAEWAVDLIPKQIETGVIEPDMLMIHLALNPNPRVFKLVEEQFTKKSLNSLALRAVSLNPNAIPFLRQHPEVIDRHFILLNPMARELIEDMKVPIDFQHLAGNDAQWAVDLLLQHYNETGQVYGEMSRNKNKEILKLLFTQPNKINWAVLSANPTAIEYLRAHPERVSQLYIYENPAAFEFPLRDALLTFLLEL